MSEKQGLAMITDLFGIDTELNPDNIWVDGLGMVKWVWSDELNDHVLVLVEETNG